MTSIIPRRLWERLTARAPKPGPIAFHVHIPVGMLASEAATARVIEEAIRRHRDQGGGAVL